MNQTKVKSTKTSKRKAANSLTEGLPHVEFREKLIKTLRPRNDPEIMLTTAQKKDFLAPDLDKEANQELLRRLTLTFGIENDWAMLESVDGDYQGLALELRRNLITEFGCTSYSEKILVDAIVSGYMRHQAAAIHFSRSINQWPITSSINTFLSTLSKEMDRANRHMLTAYQTLINLKRPPVNVQIKANKAYVAAQQQINTIEQLTKKDE